MAIGVSLPQGLLQAIARRMPARYVLEGDVDVSRITVHLPGLLPAFDNFCIVHISDLHLGDGMWIPPHIDDAARIVCDSPADLVVNTGDHLQKAPSIHKTLNCILKFMPQEVQSRTAPAHVAILGNHDYYAGESEVRSLLKGLRSAGVTVLVNESKTLVRDGSELTVVGLTLSVPGFENGVAQLLAAGRPRVVLVHEPEVAERLPYGSADLILAGHTHGGQIALPGLKRLIVRLFCGSRYVEGLYTVNGMQLYINRGLGCTGVPLRLGARPEVTVVRLRR